MRSAIINRQSFRLILAALLLFLVSCGSVTDQTLEEIFEQSYTIEPTASITIKNGDGAIHVYGSTATEMRVEAAKRAYTSKRLKQIAINVSVQPGSVSIETNFPKKRTWGLFDRSGAVDYTIVVPQTASISRLELDNGEVLVDGMHGQTMRAQLGNGRMFGHNCISNCVLTVARGALVLDYDWWEPGKFSIEANIANGNASAFVPSEAAFHLIAETVHGEIANDFDERDERDAEETRQIDMLVHGGGEAGLKMSATEGDIKIVEQGP